MYRSSPTHCWFIKPAELVEELYKNSQPICEEDLQKLLSLGISINAIRGCQWNPIAQVFSSFVDFYDEGFFLFERNGEKAFIVVQMDTAGCVEDFVAFSLDGRFSTFLNRSSLLGSGPVDDPRIYREELELLCNPLEWLRNDRTGVVVLDANKARWRLSEWSLYCKNNQYAFEISGKLCLPVPRIFTEIDQ